MFAPMQYPSHDVAGIETVPARGSHNEIGELVGTAHEVFLVEDARGQPPKEAQPDAVFEDLSTRAKQCRSQCYVVAKVDEVILITTGAEQQQQYRFCDAGTWHEAMDKL